MFKLVSWVGVAVVAASVSFAQDQQEHQALKKKTAPQVSNAPVTQGEARATFNRVASLLSSVTQKPLHFAPSTLSNSSQPVSREQIVVEMDRLVKGTSPCFKETPRAVWYDPAVVTIKKGTPARSMIDRLIKQGFVARMCLLATASADTMSVDEFGDTVGVFVSRAADLAHLPTPKFSPYIEKN